MNKLSRNVKMLPDPIVYSDSVRLLQYVTTNSVQKRRGQIKESLSKLN